MLAPALALLAFGAQNSTPAIDAGSVYGMKTYTTNPEFGFLPDKYVLGFAPTDMESMTMAVKRGQTELTKGSFYPTDTPYNAFKVLRYQAEPTIQIAEPGDYVIEFQYKGQAVSSFPFKLEKKTSGDEFNSTVRWDFITPMDRAAAISFSDSEPDAQCWLSAFLSPLREGIPLKTSVTATLSHGGKVVANTLPHMLHEGHNTRFGTKLFVPGGRTPFTKAALQKLSGTVTGKIASSSKTLRTFTWNVSDGKVQLHPRSASSYSPRADYWIPRRLAAAAEGRQFYHLEQQHWAVSP